MPEADDDRPTVPITPLVADLLTGMMTQTQSVTQRVHDMQEAEIARLRAELELVRAGVQMCFDGPYMPTETRVLRALWPSDGAIKARASDLALQRL